MEAASEDGASPQHAIPNSARRHWDAPTTAAVAGTKPAIGGAISELVGAVGLAAAVPGEQHGSGRQGVKHNGARFLFSGRKRDVCNQPKIYDG